MCFMLHDIMPIYAGVFDTDDAAIQYDKKAV